MKVLQNTFVQELYKKSGREPIEYSYLELVNMTKDLVNLYGKRICRCNDE